MNESGLNLSRKMTILLRCNKNVAAGDRIWPRPLDGGVPVGKAPPAMIFRTLPLAAIALFALSACNNNSQKPVEVTSVADDPQAAAVHNRPMAELPPPIKADVTFRCKDNSLAYVIFFEGDKVAMVKTAKDGSPVRLTAEKAGDPLKAEGYSLTGTPKNITLTAPGKGTLTCKA